MSQSPPNPPGEDEPLYGGFSRFEVELEVSDCFRLLLPDRQSLLERCMLTSNTAVCSVARESVLLESPRIPEASLRPGIHPIPQIPAVLEQTAISTLPYVSRPDAQAS